MNPYNRINVLPENLSVTDVEEDTILETEYKDNEESQSLISYNYKKHYGIERINSKISFDEDIGDFPDSQPMFTEIDYFSDSTKDKKNMAMKRKIDNMLNHEESSLIIKTSKNHRSSDEVNDRESETEAKSNKESNKQEAKSDTKNGDNIPSSTCIECFFDKELDKRNYYFGNLLIGELQFLPPCMRSEAYMTILKYVDSLKQQHRKRVNN